VYPRNANGPVARRETGPFPASSSRPAAGSGRVKTEVLWVAGSSADADLLWRLRARRLVWRGGLFRNSGLSLLEHDHQTL
jgi:hypothetical protein